MSNALIQVLRVEIKASLVGLVPQNEIVKLVNKELEKQLCGRTVQALSALSQSYSGSRGERLANARAALESMMAHVHEEIINERLSIDETEEDSI